MSPESASDLVALGAWLHIPSGFGAEIVSAGGFDWCCIDRQHGLIDEGDMFDMIRAISGVGIEPVVRVSGANASEIGRALDAGASTIIVPNVVSLDEAVTATQACAFMPDGRRSFAATRSKLFDPPAVRCMVMIETAPALEHLAQIAALPGLAGLFVGPADLRRALRFDDEAVATALRRVAGICAEHGLVPGAFVGTADISEWCSLGYRFLALDSDSNLLFSSATSLLARARAQLSGKQTEPAP
jgi:4-hydroxy-2-oxoheptanedioate aldolase